MRNLIALLLCCAFAGCSPPPFRATAVFVGYVGKSDGFDFNTRGLDGHGIVQLLHAKVLWRDYVNPRLPLKMRDDPKMKEGLKITCVENRRVGEKIHAQLNFEILYGGEPVLMAICEGYSAYRSRNDPSQTENGRQTSDKEKSSDQFTFDVRKL